MSGEAFALENVGRGAAFADYDSDGDVDVAVVVNGGPARLLRNDGGNTQGWARVILRGPSPLTRRPSRAARFATSSFATGARVTIRTGSLTQVREIGSGPSYLSQSPPGEALFGVGEARSIDSLEVVWPSGAMQSFRDLPARSRVTLTEGEDPRVVPEGNEERKALVIRFWETFHTATARRLGHDCAAAVQGYRDALSLDPRHEDSLYYLGQCLQDLGRHAEARDAFDRLVTLNPASARGHLALGALLASPVLSAPLDLAAAEEHLRRAHAINREESGPMVRLGEILIVRGDLAQAREWLEAAVRTNPKSVEAAFLTGYLKWLAGDREGARAAYGRALNASKGDAPTRGVLAEGDRKAEPAKDGSRVVAPPLKDPMGQTLFGAFSAHLRGGAPSAAAPDPSVDDLDPAYEPVRDFASRVARRSE